MNTHQRTYTTWVVFALSVLVLQACSILDPMRAAETTEQRAFAAYGTYVIFVERAAELMDSPALSDDNKLRIIAAVETSTTVTGELFNAMSEYEAAKALLDQGQTTEERVLIASQNLNSWVEKAMPLIQNLISAIQGAT